MVAIVIKNETKEGIVMVETDEGRFLVELEKCAGGCSPHKVWVSGLQVCVRWYVQSQVTSDHLMLH